MSQTTRSALLAGATGLTGGFVLDLLLGSPHYGAVKALVRRALPRADDRLQPIVTDFDRLEAVAGDFEGVEDVFCCLGTTLRKAGSQQAFRRVDFEYVSTLARLARQAGARRFLVMSSVGADAASGNFYLSVKGEAEAAVTACGYPELHIFRPGILTGPRQESRPAEKLGIFAAKVISPVLLGGLRRYRPIAAQAVAAAMLSAALAGGGGRQVYTNAEIERLAADPA